MRNILKPVFAVTLALSIVACGPKSNKPGEPGVQNKVADADLSELLDQPLKIEGATEAGLEGLVAALPENMTLTWDSKTFESESGATVLEGLAFALGDEHKFGVRFDEARVWGLETDLLAARLAGQRLEESGPLFTRFDGTNMTYFGVSAAVNAMLEMVLDNWQLNEPQLGEIGLDTFEVSSARVIVSDLSLRPWEYEWAPKSLVAGASPSEQDQLLDLVHLGQQLIAVNRSIAYSRAVIEDTRGQVVMRLPYETTTLEMRWDRYGYSDVSGFDFGEIVSTNGYSRQVTTYADAVDTDDVLASPEATFLSGQSLVQEETFGRSRISGLRLDTLMGYLARSELPGTDVRDLLSLGVWEVDNYAVKFNDKQLLSAESASFQADTWAWIFPEVIDVKLDNATVHIHDSVSAFGQIALLGFASTYADDLEDPEQAAEFEKFTQGLDKTIELLPQHGLSEITFDFSSKMRWGADSGETTWDLLFEADGFGDTVFEISLDLPTYDVVEKIMAAEDKEQAAEDAFEADFAFKGARFMERDRGGYDKIFGFANAIGKEYADQGWGAMLANMEPAQMRSYLATIVRMGKPGVAKEIPQAADWLESYAAYLGTGGQFEFKVAPPEPINAAFAEAHPDPEPDEVVSFLGITVTHTK